MDDQIYSKSTIEKFLNENLLFRDAKLKKYYDRNLQRDLGKFRSRVHSTHSKKDFEKVVYLLITDSLRDIILETVGEISEYMKDMGDIIVSGGDRKSTRLNSSHLVISYAVFCLKKKK